jgi:hypothetical protein
MQEKENLKVNVACSLESNRIRKRQDFGSKPPIVKKEA